MIVEILRVLSAIYYNGFAGNVPPKYGATPAEFYTKLPPFVANNVVDIPEFIGVVAYLFGVEPALPATGISAGRDVVHSAILAVMRYAMDNDLVTPGTQDFDNLVEIAKDLFLSNPQTRNIDLVAGLITTINSDELITQLLTLLPTMPGKGVVPKISPEQMMTVVNLLTILAEAMPDTHPQMTNLLLACKQIIDDAWPYNQMIFAALIFLFYHTPPAQMDVLIDTVIGYDPAPLMWMRLFAILGERTDYGLVPAFLSADSLQKKAFLAWALSQSHDPNVTDYMIDSFDLIAAYEDDDEKWVDVILTSLANNGDSSWLEKAVLKATHLGGLADKFALQIFQRVRAEEIATSGGGA